MLHSDPPRTRSQRSATALRAAWQWVPLPLGALLLWQLAVKSNWLPPQTLPAPTTVLATLWQLTASGELPRQWGVSLGRLLAGLLAGSVTGGLLGAGMARSPRLEALLRLPLSAAMQIPTLAWIPLFMVCFGIGETLKLVVLIKAVAIPMLTHALTGFRDIPPNLREVADLQGLSGWRRWRRLYLPAALPSLLTGFRLAVSQAWLSLLVVELLASSAGIGYLIVDGRQLFQIDVVMAGMVVIGLTGLAMDAGLSWVERHLTWPAGTPAVWDRRIELSRCWQWSGFGVLAGLLLLWQVLSLSSATARAAQATPGQVLDYAGHALLDGSLGHVLLASLQRYLAGLALGLLGGTAVGIVLGWSPATNRLLGPGLRFVRHIAIFAWLPLLTAWVGLGELAKVSFVALATALTMLTATAAGMQASPHALGEVASLLGLSPWQRFRRLRWPAALTQVFSGLQLCLVQAWLATIGAEFFLSSSPGLGSLMINAGQSFQMDAVITAMLTMGLLGYGFHRAGRWLEHSTTDWREQRKA
ncbi:ABC transporter permease [Frateuria aurantia]